jgi:hypothetical protein
MSSSSSTLSDNSTRTGDNGCSGKAYAISARRSKLTRRGLAPFREEADELDMREDLDAVCTNFALSL